MKRFIAAIIILFAALGASPNAKNRYISPIGDNTNNGQDTGTAWRTLGYAVDNLVAGDTLFVMGGYYTHEGLDTTNADNRNACAFQASGTAANPIVIKAYGANGADGGRAHFWGTGISSYSSRYYVLSQGYDYVKIDGWSYTSPTDSLFLVWEGIGGAWTEVSDPLPSSTNYATIREVFQLDNTIGWKINGVEVNGNHPPMDTVWNDYFATRGELAVTSGGPIRYVMRPTRAVCDTIVSCYMHHIFYPTGDRGIGDRSDRSQGCGEVLLSNTGCRLWYIANNTFTNSGHAVISLQDTRACKIINNKITNYWGGGVYVVHYNDRTTRYNLIEGNLFYHAGETTTKTKNPIGLESPANVIRKNVVWAPDYYGNGGIELKTQYNRAVDSCLIYNNTFYDCDHGGIALAYAGSTNPSYTATINNCTIANNISYASKNLATDVANMRSELQCYLYEANLTTDWVEPNTSANCGRPETTHFGNNNFWNNCLMKDWRTATVPNPQLISYTDPRDACGVTWGWSLDTVVAKDPTAWSGNIEQNPQIKFDGWPDYAAYYGLEDSWWHITTNSPCRDAGTEITDNISALVSAEYGAAYAWDTLAYEGDSPDIGAYEYVLAGCNCAPQSINFGSVAIDATRNQAIIISNGSPDDPLTLTFLVSDSTIFTLPTAGESFEIPADSLYTLIVSFTPAAASAYADTILFNASCDTVFLAGYGYEPSATAGSKKVIIKD